MISYVSYSYWTRTRVAAHVKHGCSALIVGEWQSEVVIMTSEHSEPAPELPAADEISVEELARRQGVRPVASVDDMARPGLFDSDQDWDEFLNDLYAARRAGLA